MFETQTPSSADVANQSTAALDEAKKEPSTERQEYFAKLKEFFSNTISSGFRLLIWCIFSLLVIYFCKVAQANVLPTDGNCYPYTDEKGHEPEKIETYIFTNLFFRKPRKASILEFPDTHNSLTSIITSIRDYKNNTKSSFLGNFFYSIFESLFLKNFNYYNYMFSFLNQLPEFILVIFGPYLAYFIMFISVFVNVIFFCYYWLSNLGWMWKKNVNIIIDEKTGNVKYKPGPPDWQNVHWNELPDPNDKTKTIEGSSEWTSCLVAIFLSGIFFFALFSLMPILFIFGAIFSLICLISMLMYKINFAGKKSSITDLFIYFFKYNKLIIMSMFSFYVIMNAFTYLGYTSAIFAVLTLFCIYYFKIIEMFVPVKSDLDERVEVEINSSQAYKVPCDPPPEKDIIGDNTGTGVNKERTASFRDRMMMGTTSKIDLPSTSNPTKPATQSPVTQTNQPATPNQAAPSPATQTNQPTTPNQAAPTKSWMSKMQNINVFGPDQRKIFSRPATQQSSVQPQVAPTNQPPPQSGGKKQKPIEIDSNNIVRELKKFHKKYTQFLL
jgi:hypothetical protein